MQASSSHSRSLSSSSVASESTDLEQPYNPIKCDADHDDSESQMGENVELDRLSVEPNIEFDHVPIENQNADTFITFFGIILAMTTFVPAGLRHLTPAFFMNAAQCIEIISLAGIVISLGFSLADFYEPFLTTIQRLIRGDRGAGRDESREVESENSGEEGGEGDIANDN